MLKITFTVERRKQVLRQAEQERRQTRRLHPLLALAFIYYATLTTSQITGDSSLLRDFTKGLVQFASRLLGFDVSA